MVVAYGVLSLTGAKVKPGFPVGPIIEQLQLANPARDLAAAKSKGDYRFVAVCGDGTVVPGVTKIQADAIILSKNFSCIAGTGPAITPEKEKLNKLASQYGAKYNALLQKSTPPGSQ